MRMPIVERETIGEGVVTFMRRGAGKRYRAVGEKKGGVASLGWERLLFDMPNRRFLKLLCFHGLTRGPRLLLLKATLVREPSKNGPIWSRLRDA